MENIRRVFLWEMIRMDPKIFFILKCVNTGLSMSLERDPCYLHWFLEEFFGIYYARSLEWNECCKLLKRLLIEVPNRIISLIYNTTTIQVNDIYNHTTHLLTLPLSTTFYAQNWA